jgi:hypothetical protein
MVGPAAGRLSSAGVDELRAPPRAGARALGLILGPGPARPEIQELRGWVGRMDRRGSTRAG